VLSSWDLLVIKNMAPRVGHARMAEILHSQVFRMSNLYLERELALGPVSL